MILDVSEIVLDVTGNPVKNSDREDDFLTVRTALVLALTRGEAKEAMTDEMEIIRKTDLALKIYNAPKEIELKCEDQVLLKRLLAGLVRYVGFNPLVAGLLIKKLD